MSQTTIDNVSKLHPIIHRLLKARNFDSGKIADFFSWDLRKLPDFSLMQDINKAAQRVAEAIEKKEKIAVFGDYDVDGTTSCALLYFFFKMFDHEIEIIQPSRFVEGYGLHPSSIQQAAENNISLMITVDCGITSIAAAETALEHSIDLIITDHHKDAAEEMPKAFAIVNPNRRDEPTDSDRCNLAGVGVAFALALEVRKVLEAAGQKAPSIYPLLQFVAMGTICDLAKLNPMNIKFVRHGLKQIKETTYPGIMALFKPEDRALPFIPSEKLSFNVGPLINSKGRLDHPEKAIQLLISKDSESAYECYSHLEICNKERRFIQSEVFEDAKEQIISGLNSDEQVISIAYAPDWHEGVIGIVASKLVENFKVPSIVLTNASEEGVIKGSARSAGELDIFQCLNSVSDLFSKFGGHKSAAGLSMPKENLPAFRERMNQQLKEIPAVIRREQSHFDLDISAADITPRLLKELELLEPFGEGNRTPVFRIRDLKIESFDILKEIHIRWNFSQLNNPSNRYRGISFNYLNSWGAVHPHELYTQQTQSDVPLTVYCTLGINRFNGNEYIQLQVKSISSSELS